MWWTADIRIKKLKLENRLYFILSGMGNRFTRCCLIPLLLLACICVGAKEWTADNIPMVHLQDASQYICDPDNLMEGQARDSANHVLARLDRQCGIESVFVIVNQVEDGDAFRVAQDIGNRQGVGSKKTNRGLVVVIAVDDRRYFIAPGEGLEKDLTDIECDDIARACIVLNMRMGDTDAAVLSTVRAIYNKFRTGSTGLADSDNEGEGDTAVGILILVFVLAVWLLWFLRRNDGNGGNNIFGGGTGPFIFWGNPGHVNDHSFGGGSFGGSFGGGSFGGGGAGGGW